MEHACYRNQSNKMTDKRPVNLIIAGPPASGKGSQCSAIKKSYGLIHLSSGDMLRDAIKAKSDVGIKAQEYMNRGDLVPDEIVEHSVLERLQKDDVKSKGFLLDGFPRTASQAEFLIQNSLTPDGIIFLNVPDDVVIERVGGRRVDPVTSETYHIKYNPAPKEIQDRLIIRSDDTEEKIKNRLVAFHKEIKAILDQFDGKIYTVKYVENMTIADVTEQVLKMVDQIKSKI